MATNNDKPSMIIIEGAIGAGKSTTIEMLAKDPELATRFFFETEPFEAFSNYVGCNIVQEYYEGKCTPGFLQTLVHKSQLLRDMKAMERAKETGLIPVLERSSYSSLVFINWLWKRELITAEEKERLEADISSHQELSGLPPISDIAVIYLENDRAFANVQERGRPGELLSLNKRDGRSLHFCYEEFIGGDYEKSRFAARHVVRVREASVTAEDVTQHVKEILLEGALEQRMCTKTSLPWPSAHYRTKNRPESGETLSTITPAPLIALPTTNHSPLSMIVIEGLIGSGKSTTIKKLAADVSLQSRFFFEEEPFESFTNYSGHNLVKDYYEGKCDPTYFESMVHKSVLVRDMKAAKKARTTGLTPVLERSSWTTAVFVNWLEAAGLLTSHDLVLLLAEFAEHCIFAGIPDMSQVGVIYLKNDFAEERTRQRGLPWEQCLTHEQFQQLSDTFTSNLSARRLGFGALHTVLIASRNITRDQVASHVKRIIEEGEFELGQDIYSHVAEAE